VAGIGHQIGDVPGSALGAQLTDVQAMPGRILTFGFHGF
jgi:hypothetical protein